MEVVRGWYCSAGRPFLERLDGPGFSKVAVVYAVPQGQGANE